MSRTKACVVCGRRGLNGTARCERHPLEPAPRGNSFESTRVQVAEAHGWICHLCHEAIESLEDLHIDHVVPRARGGTSNVANLRPAHASCNLTKGASMGASRA